MRDCPPTIASISSARSLNRYWTTSIYFPQQQSEPWPRFTRAIVKKG